MDNIFIRALQRKLRFTVGTKGGQLTAEDLFDLKPSELDAMYRKLQVDHALLSDGLVRRVTTEISDAELARAIICTVFEIKALASEEATKRTERAERRRKILEIIAEKKEGDLKAKSLEELTALLDASGN